LGGDGEDEVEARSDPAMARIVDTRIVPESSGTIIFPKTCISVAPSICAASIMPESIFCKFARNIIIVETVYIQMSAKRWDTSPSRP
jgi:hypothetical protein